MSRLLHSYMGQLRSMQISATNLFIFVEGKKSDSYIYSGIYTSLGNSNINYEICLAEQLPGNSGGKHALLVFFGFLQKQKKLVSDLGGRKTTCIFFLDKDLDDLKRCKKRSAHVVYTEHYDAINYIFLHGNLVVGAAAAASIDPQYINQRLCDSAAWCATSAELWREWVTLCLRMAEDSIPCEANYRVPSPIQRRPSSSTDQVLYNNMVNTLSTRAGVTTAHFKTKLQKTRAKVDRYFKAGLHNRIFKGKWFPIILADEIDKIMAGRPFDKNGLIGRLPSTIASTIDFKEAWADRYREAITIVISKL